MLVIESLPPQFVQRMRERLGPELPAFLAALADPTVGLRVNTLRITPAAFEEISPCGIQPLSYPPEGFSVERSCRPGRHPFHAAGLYYLQDPGAMAVGALVGAVPGERVLDLAAAPGGKTTHLAARMENRGILVANEVSRKRAAELVGNLERCGVTNAIVTSAEVKVLAERFGPAFDRVLLDAPCSGESMFHKSEAAVAAWSETSVVGCARRQIDLLRDAAELVAPEGALVYSTCTFEEEENEEVVSRLLEERPDFRVVPLPTLRGAEEVDLGDATEGASGPRAPGYRLWPHRFAGAGHFVAALRRVTGEVEAWREAKVSTRDRLPDLNLDPARIRAHRDVLSYAPERLPVLEGLSVHRVGVELGRLLPGRFEPSYALALAVRPERSANRVSLEIADPRVTRYLAGHPIEAEGPPGWALVDVGGFALGWGKRVGTTVKNHYPKGLRWLG